MMSTQSNLNKFDKGKGTNLIYKNDKYNCGPFHDGTGTVSKITKSKFSLDLYVDSLII